MCAVRKVSGVLCLVEFLLLRGWHLDAGAWAVLPPWRFARVARAAGCAPAALGDLLSQGGGG